LLAWQSALAFNFEDVAERARQLAAASFRPQESKLPSEIEKLNYDEFRDIRFKPARSLWRADRLPFEIAFFHEGLFFKQPVKINEVSVEGVHEIKFTPDLFDYGSNKIDPGAMRDLGFAGFRVHYAINSPRYKDDCWCFLGASYFRALGKARSMDCQRGACPSTRDLRRVKNFRASWNSGSSGRCRPRPSLRSTPCSIRGASVARIASCSSPGRTR
jgi:glucans biosynthesis protein